MGRKRGRQAMGAIFWALLVFIADYLPRALLDITIALTFRFAWRASLQPGIGLFIGMMGLKTLA